MNHDPIEILLKKFQPQEPDPGLKKNVFKNICKETDSGVVPFLLKWRLELALGAVCLAALFINGAFFEKNLSKSLIERSNQQIQEQSRRLAVELGDGEILSKRLYRDFTGARDELMRRNLRHISIFKGV